MSKKTEDAEIDLMDVILLIKDKSKSIMLFMISLLFLVSIFLWINNDKISIAYEIKTNTDWPSMVVNCDEDVDCKADCKADFLEGIVKNYSAKYNIIRKKGDRGITLTWSGSSSQKDIFNSDVDAIKKNIESWYIQDHVSYGRIMDENKHKNIGSSDLYAKVDLLTKRFFSEKEVNIFIENEKISKKYNTILVIALTLIIGFFVSISYHLLLRSIRGMKKEI